MEKPTGSFDTFGPFFTSENLKLSTVEGNTCMIPNHYKNSWEDKGLVSFHLFNEGVIAFINQKMFESCV